MYEWTVNLTATDDLPLVHAITFAWQHNLSDFCVDSTLDAIDANLAKLAAKGITVLAAAGDAGCVHSAVMTVYPLKML